MKPIAPHIGDIQKALMREHNIEPLERIAQRIVNEPYTPPDINTPSDNTSLQDTHHITSFIHERFADHIVPTVNAFLNIDMHEEIAITVDPQRAVSSYLRETGDIVIGSDVIRLANTHNGMKLVEAVCAHEYAHHLQERLVAYPIADPYNIQYAPFAEGHAYGPEFSMITLPIAHVPAMQYRKNAMDLLLIDTYSSIARSHQHPVVPDAIERQSKIYLSQGRISIKYAFGHALFSIATEKHGPGIYAEALRNPRVVLE